MASSTDVEKLSALARITIPEEGREKFAAEFDGVLAYVGKLEELTLPEKGTSAPSAVRNIFREDGEPHEKGKYTKALVDQFPQKEEDYLAVKQIIKND